MNKYGSEIVELLKEEGITIDLKIENTINVLAYDIFNKGVNKGIETGQKIGVNKVCEEFENKISILKDENIIE